VKARMSGAFCLLLLFGAWMSGGLIAFGLFPGNEMMTTMGAIVGFCCALPVLVAFAAIGRSLGTRRQRGELRPAGRKTASMLG
jgi:hypothetical protein